MFLLRMIASKLLSKIERTRKFKKMYTYPDKAGKYFWIYGSWEAWNIEILKNHFFPKPTNGVFLDLGANLGCYSINLAEHFQEVWSFEPAPIASAVLYANIESNKLGNCKIIKKGVGKKAGTETLNIIPSNSGMSSIINRNSDSIGVEIDIVSLDSIIPETVNIDLIKIDIEGFELDALLGAKEILKMNNAVIQFELDTTSGMEKSHKIISLLQGLGYKKFYQRKRSIFYRILRRLYIQDLQIENFKLQSDKFYQAVWATK
tara:strand:- start:3854 stop:4636 length:783 start_codon:yes stop_codon:yes gene_type:complete